MQISKEVLINLIRTILNHVYFSNCSAIVSLRIDITLFQNYHIEVHKKKAKILRKYIHYIKFYSTNETRQTSFTEETSLYE